MGTYRLGVLDGDAVGPEIVGAAVSVLQAATTIYGQGTDFDYLPLPIGYEAFASDHEPVPERTKAGLRQVDGWLMGPHDNAAYPAEMQRTRNPSGELRHTFDLYANIRPSRTLPGCHSLVGDADLIIVRENSEGFLSDRNMYQGTGEAMVTPDVALTSGAFTRKAITRIAHTAFDLAKKRRQKVTIVHKANVLKYSFGLFRDVCYEVAKEYSEVTVNDMHIDAFTAHLVRNAQQFDVVVTENLFGDIVSDLAGELVGSLGMSASINTNGTQAMAQAAHGAAPDIAGQNIANPTSMILSTAMLLDWLGTKRQDPTLNALGQIITTAVDQTLVQGIHTRDLGGTASTTDFVAAVIMNLAPQD
ncbi:MAG: isocitrate/isopropylmalate family dehydrogenase [Lactobacillus sp.]|jgi:3-isopropylmalate dehydrogenase|nr:isocitrate/isopropylmalate family dehydrogenase [Lactobacillus sp.]MCI2031927.1 isocitrate/isopropylmalate family dehydrogenase [Lactobacillus sp.]